MHDRESFGIGRESFGIGRESFGIGRESFGIGRESFGIGRDSFGIGVLQGSSLLRCLCKCQFVLNTFSHFSQQNIILLQI